VPGSTLTVAVDVTDPPAGGVTGFEENETWIPLGNVEVVSVTGELNDEGDVIVTKLGAELPLLIVIAAEPNPSVKSAEAVTVSAKDVEWVPEEPVPLIVIVYVPTGALGPTLIVKLDEAVPPDGTEIGLGLKAEKVTPEGTEPVTDKVTEPEKLN